MASSSPSHPTVGFQLEMKMTAQKTKMLDQHLTHLKSQKQFTGNPVTDDYMRLSMVYLQTMIQAKQAYYDLLEFQSENFKKECEIRFF
ncbi:unnamed protein product [Adineta ricciae]|uniref:Uncharacterized protein n=1 Tax=Adineta ricciae TaxID=249248 RepID=A0A815DE09_ADIRI|nr:unnamed protein product [Adineta ricciae]CAF1482854.1 unnamed protein product [Adineta ricciae]